MTALFLWPDTVGGWVAMLLSVVLIVAAVGGVAVNVLVRYVQSTSYRDVHTEVPGVVETALREVNAKLDGIRINQAEASVEIARVRMLETKIDNGLTHKVADIGATVDRIKQRQIALVGQVAEMHGWMQAQNRYDGVERRTT